MDLRPDLPDGFGNPGAAQASVRTTFGASPRFDLIAALVLTACTAFWGDLFGSGPHRDDYLASVLTSIGLVMPLALRRSHPMLMTALMTVAGLAQVWLVDTPTWSLIAVPAACYSVARWVPGHRSRLVVASGAMGSVVGPLRWVAHESVRMNTADLVPAAGPLIALCLAWVLIPYLLGRRDRETVIARQERDVLAQARYESELARREQQTRAAEARVRNEIARELHDVVAHSLSVIIVQANGGKALARRQPEAAAEVLETISATGREALDEMRRIVGVLRADPDNAGADFRPAPGLDDIPAMVAKAGDRVQLSITGNRPMVKPAIGVSAYRVVQEGLTNFLKHAGPNANATVALIYLPNQIVIEVADDGRGASVIPQTGQGYGLQGMRERVSAMGGQLDARATRAGGWVVRASLPLASGVSAPAGDDLVHNGAKVQQGQNSEGR